MKTVSLVVVITLAGKVLGLARDMLLNHTFGTGMEAQAFFTASRIPRTFFDAVFASAISSSFIPVFNEQMEKRGRGEAFALANGFFTWVGIITAVIAGLGMAFAPQLTALFSDYENPETVRLTEQLLLYMFPTILFTGLGFSMVGVLQSLGEFNIPAAMSVVSNGTILLYYAFFVDDFGVFGLAVAFLIGWALQAVMQAPPLIRRGFRFRPRLRADGLKKIIKLMLPVMVSTWIQPINLTVSARFASGLLDGEGTSAIENANNLYVIVAGVLVLSIANVIFPEMSRLTAGGKLADFNDVAHRATRSILFLLIPMTVGLMLLSEPVVRLLFQRGEFTALDTENTARALFYMTLGMVGYGLQSILSRAFYAMKNGTVPLIGGAVSIVLNLLLCALLAPRHDVAGLALASAVSLSVSAVLLVIPMQRMTRAYITWKLTKDVGKMLAAALGMGAVILPMRILLDRALPERLMGRILLVLIPVIAGILLYMAFTKCLKLPEAEQAASILKKFRRRGGGDDVS